MLLEGLKRDVLQHDGVSASSWGLQTPKVSVSTVWPAEGRPVSALLSIAVCLQALGPSLPSARGKQSCSPPGTPKSRQTLPSILPPKPQGDDHVVFSLGPPPKSRAKEVIPPNLPQNARHWDRPPQTLLGAQVPGTEAAILPAPESSPHASPCPPSLACPDLPKQRCFSPGSLGSPHFRQTCACFPSAQAHLGLPLQAPPYPGDKPRIVFIDLINDSTPLPPATDSASPPSFLFL